MTIKHILHLADTQIDFGSSKYSKMRNLEMYTMVDRIIDKAKNELLTRNLSKFDFVTYTGDITEIYNPNDTSRDLIAYFITKLSELCENFIIIEGNHDLKKVISNVTIDVNEVKQETTLLEHITSLLNISNVHYLKHSGLYNIGNQSFIVWSHYDKLFNSNKYNPYELGLTIDPNNCIELFHDPVNCYTDFDGKNIIDIERYDSYVSLNQFKSPLVLAGDIHAPQIHINNNNNTTFTYCSSTIARNFGEGLYITDDVVDVNGNNKHGFNIVKFNDNNIKDHEVVFVPVNQFTSRVTLKITQKTDITNTKHIEDICNVISNNSDGCGHLMLRINVSDIYKQYKQHSTSFIQYVQKYLCNKLKCSFYYEYIGNKIDDEYIENYKQDINADTISQKGTIVESAHNYIDELIDSNKQIASKEDKAKTKTMLKQLFDSEMDIVYDNNVKHNVIDIKLLNITNFCTITDNIVIDFTNRNGIIRIDGTNGGGKTTLYQFISYMLYDITNLNQTIAHRKKNTLHLFNDYTLNDTMYNKMFLTVNGINHTITKKVTREWVKNKNRENGGKNWREYVSNLVFEYELNINDAEFITEPDKITEYFNSILNIDIAYRTVFVDSSNIHSLLNSKPDVISNSILNGIGVNFIDSMLNRYDVVRSETLKKLTKHKEDNTVLENKIINNNNEITNVDSKLVILDRCFSDINKQLLDESNNYDKLLININSEIDTNYYTKYKDSIHNIKDIKTHYNTYFDSIINGKINRHKDTICNLNSDLSNIGSILNDDELLDYENKLIEYNNSIINLDLLINANDKEIEKLYLLLPNLENKIDNEKNRIENDINKRINENNTKITDIKALVTRIKDKLTNDITLRKTQINNQISSINNDVNIVINDINKKEIEIYGYTIGINNINGEVKLITHQIEDNTNIIDILSNKKPCHVCGNMYVNDDKHNKISEYDYDTLVKSNKELNLQINKLNNDISGLKSNIDSIKVSIKELESKKTSILNEIKTLESNYINITDTKTIVNGLLTGEITKREDFKTFKLKSLDNLFSKLNTNYYDLIENKGSLENELEHIDKKQVIIDLRYKFEEINLDINNLTNINDQHKDTKITLSNELIKINDIISNNEDNKNKCNEIKSLIELESIQIELLSNLDCIDEQILFEQIQNSINSISNIKKTINEYTEEKHTNLSNKSLLNTQNNLFITMIEENNEYTRVENMFKLYKKFVSKNGFPQYLFSSIASSMNLMLSDMLTDMQFTPVFDMDGEIKLYDKKHNTLRNASRFSGMEETISGISIIEMMRRFNSNTVVNFVCIDELTGKLNNGEDLPYDCDNYQNEFLKILNNIKEYNNDTNNKLFIIDHVIKNINEDVKITVVPSSIDKATNYIITDNCGNIDLY